MMFLSWGHLVNTPKKLCENHCKTCENPFENYNVKTLKRNNPSFGLITITTWLFLFWIDNIGKPSFWFMTFEYALMTGMV